MKLLSETLSQIARKPGRWTVAGLPEGADSLALAVACDVQNILAAGRAGDLGQGKGVGALGQAGDGPAAGLAMEGSQPVGKRLSHGA